VHFHLKTLTADDFLSGNIEDLARNYRLDFFKNIYQSIDAQALLLGHQQEDQAETVLKRILEGSGILSCASLKMEVDNNGMCVLRPLVIFRKQQLMDWLDALSQNNYVIDPTNLQDQFLRGRMRTEIFPFLENSFRKNVVSSLCNFSDDLEIVSKYFQKMFTSYLSFVNHSLFATYLDFSELPSLDVSLYSLFTRFLFKELNLPCSRDSADLIAELLLNKAVNKKISTGNGFVYIENQILFIPKKIPSWPATFPIKEGIYDLEGWTLEIFWIDGPPDLDASTWKQAIDGLFYVNLPNDEFYLINFEQCNLISGNKKNKNKLSEFKVPCFLRELFPFVSDSNQLIYEFLTGKVCKEFDGKNLKQLNLKVSLNDK